MKTNKQRTFEEEFKNQLDFTPGDLLSSTYKDPTTEQKWRTWLVCWNAIVGRFDRKLSAALVTKS